MQLATTKVRVVRGPWSMGEKVAVVDSTRPAWHLAVGVVVGFGGGGNVKVRVGGGVVNVNSRGLRKVVEGERE